MLLLASLYANSEFESIKKQYFKSYNYEQMGQYTEAIKVLSPLYQKYADGYTLNLRFGWLFYLDKKYKDAIVYYQKASLLNTYALNPKLGLIRIYLDTQQYIKAEQVSQELLKIDYYNYYANLYIINALLSQKKYKAALKNIQKMLAIYPTDVSFLEQLSLVYKATDSPYLQKVYEDILILDPNNVLVGSSRK